MVFNIPVFDITILLPALVSFFFTALIVAVVMVRVTKSTLLGILYGVLGGVFVSMFVNVLTGPSLENQVARDTASRQLPAEAERVYGLELSEEESYALVADLTYRELMHGLGEDVVAEASSSSDLETQDGVPIQLIWTGSEWALGDASKDIEFHELDRR